MQPVAGDLMTGYETGYGYEGHPTVCNRVGSYANTRTRTTTRRAIPRMQPVAGDLMLLAPQPHCGLTINSGCRVQGAGCRVQGAGFRV